MCNVTIALSQVDVNSWPHSRPVLFLRRRAPGHMAEALKGWPRSEPGHVQRAVWPAGEHSLPGQSVLH